MSWSSLSILLSLHVAQATEQASVLIYNLAPEGASAGALRAFLESGESGAAPCYLSKPPSVDSVNPASVDVLALKYTSEARAANDPKKRSLVGLRFSPGCRDNTGEIDVNLKWVVDINGPYVWRVQGESLRLASLPSYLARVPVQYRGDLIADYLRGRFDGGLEIPRCEGACKPYQRWWVNNYVGQSVGDRRAVLPSLRNLVSEGSASLSEEDARQLAVSTILEAYNAPGAEVRIPALSEDARLFRLCSAVTLRYAGSGMAEDVGTEWTLACQQAKSTVTIRLNERFLSFYEEPLPKVCRGAKLMMPAHVGVAVAVPDSLSTLAAYFYQPETPAFEIGSLPSGCSVDKLRGSRTWTVRSNEATTADFLDDAPADKPLTSVLCVPADKVHNLYEISLEVEFRAGRSVRATVGVRGRYETMPDFELVARGSGCTVSTASKKSAECRLDGDGDPWPQVKSMLRLRVPYSTCA